MKKIPPGPPFSKGGECWGGSGPSGIAPPRRWQRNRGSEENPPAPLFQRGGMWGSSGPSGIAPPRGESMRPYNPRLKGLARGLRKNMTDAEISLWQRIRKDRLNGYRFYRQRVIGNYIVDFCSPRRKLVIEVDGSQHIDRREYDAERTEFLELMGYQVLRFWNNEIMNNIDVVASLHKARLATTFERIL